MFRRTSPHAGNFAATGSNSNGRASYCEHNRRRVTDHRPPRAAYVLTDLCVLSRAGDAWQAQGATHGEHEEAGASSNVETCWAFLSAAEPYWLLLRAAECCWKLQVISESCWAPLRTSGHFWELLSTPWDLLGVFECYLALLSVFESSWVVLSAAEYCWALLRPTGRFWELLSTAECFWEAVETCWAFWRATYTLKAFLRAAKHCWDPLGIWESSRALLSGLT